MAYEWQTVEAASVTLGVSARTLARRISEGKIESRLESGRREVLVCLPDAPAIAPPAPEPVADEILNVDVSPSPSPEPQENGLALAQQRLHHAELSVAAFRQAAEMSYGEVRRARIGAIVAWSAVAALGMGIIGVTAWTTQRVTRSQDRSEFLEQRLAAANTQQAADRETQTALRQQLDHSRAETTRAQVQLQDMQVRQATSETKPPTLLERMATIFEESK